MRRCAVITSGHLQHDHVAAVEGLHGPATIDRRCADLAELVAAARAGWADAALIVGESEALTTTRLSELHEFGLVVVAVSDVPTERHRLIGLGVQALPDDVDVETLVHALQGRTVGLVSSEPPPADHLDAELADLLGSTTTAGPPLIRSAEDGSDQEVSELRASGADEQDAAAPGLPDSALVVPDAAAPDTDSPDSAVPDTASADAPPSDAALPFAAVRTLVGPDAIDDLSGRSAEPSTEHTAGGRLSGIVTIWGAPGSPGRTTVAVNLAAELVSAGARVLLIDADTIAASVATHLGLLEESAGLAQACRQADLGRLDSARLDRATTAVEIAGARLHLLTGLPRADRWPELRDRALRQVFQHARRDFDHVIVDTAAPVEQDEELTFDTRAPQRNAATICAVEESDVLIAVGAADPVGFPRLVKALEDLRTNVPLAPRPEVIINQLRREVVGRAPRDQLSEAWGRFGPEEPLETFLPWDRSGCDAALLKGQVLAEAASQSPLRHELARLAGVEVPGRRRRLPRR